MATTGPTFVPHHHHRLSRAQMPGSISALPPGFHPMMHGPPGHLPNFHPSLPPNAQPFNGPANGPPPAFFPGHHPPHHMSMHRSRPSLAGLQNGMPVPITPLNQASFMPHMAPITPLPGASFTGMQPMPHHGRSRRQPSISTGGPPKAVLGGPARRNTIVQPSETAETKTKTKKIVVNLPAESYTEEVDGTTVRRHESWSRNPIPSMNLPWLESTDAPETTTATIYPEPWSRAYLPDTVDVFLPGKAAWNALKQEVMEEKLAKLGVEPGSGHSSVFAPGHAALRATSISSPADPALLHFKLNKLQQSQRISPQPLMSPGLGPPPRLHNHSMSLAQPVLPNRFGAEPGLPYGGPSPSHNPFGPNATLGSELLTPLSRLSPSIPPSLPSVSEDEPADIIHAPQATVPIQPLNFDTSSRASSRPDFTRGFGLDVTEEAEEQNLPEDVQNDLAGQSPLPDEAVEQQEEDLQNEEDGEADTEEEPASDEFTTPSHSRHVSLASVALSLKELGRRSPGEDTVPEDPEEQEYSESPAQNWIRSHSDKWRAVVQDEAEADDWTGTDDNRAIHDDTESTGEWSNPSDEERARQENRDRRQARVEQTTPRRLPNFPLPPAANNNTYTFQPPHSEDLISNPSEEGHAQDAYYQATQAQDIFYPEDPIVRPQPSAPHSRHVSEHLMQLNHPLSYPSSNHHSRTTSLAPTETLNPHAKPFVFGSPHLANQFSTSTQFSKPTISDMTFGPGHTRQMSVGSKLNAAATEFKPGGFTFRPPPGGPTLSFPSPPRPEIPVPVPEPTTGATPARAAQGREKRQKTESTDGAEDSMLSPPIEEPSNTPRDNMANFKFPSPWKPSFSQPKEQEVDHDSGAEELPHLRPSSHLNAAAKPFTFSGFTLNSTAQPFVPTTLPHKIVVPQTEPAVLRLDQLQSPESPTAPAAEFVQRKGSRPPIPDFKLAISNLAPSSALLKSVGSAGFEGSTRPTVRSRLGSREVFEHNSRPSLDDLHMPTISRKAHRPTPLLRAQTPDVFSADPTPVDVPSLASAGLPRERRLSLPLPGSTGASSPIEISASMVSSMKNAELERYESRMEQLLENKLDQVHQDLVNITSTKADESAAIIQATIHRLIATVKSQSTENGRLDASGEFDYELLQSTIEQAQHETRASFRQDLVEFLQQLEAKRRPDDFHHLLGGLENVMHNSVSKLASHIDTVHRRSGSRDYDDRRAMLQELTENLIPHLENLRTDPLDTELLTIQLSQAVKPHISQLIDLASDKKETAGLIVQHLVPLFAKISPPPIDYDLMGRQLASQVSHIIPPPVDPHVLKEHVADLVVERLAARLAVRDNALNPEAILKGVTDAIAPLSEKLASSLPTSSIEDLVTQHQRLQTDNAALLARQEDVQSALTNLPQRLSEAVDALSSAQTKLVEKTRALDDFSELQRALAANSDLQMQLGKARGAHGQVRSEKEVISERLIIAESEREKLQAEVTRFKLLADSRQLEISELETKNGLIEAAFEKLKSDNTVKILQDRVSELESTNRSLLQETHDLKTKITTLELQSTFATRDLEKASEAHIRLEKERDALLSQQQHWDDLRRTADQIEMLSKMTQAANDEEIKELKRAHDRSKSIEVEHAALRKRYDEQESKLATLQRTAITNKQTMAQTQQRLSEWEKRARDKETTLESVRSQLEQEEEARRQLEADVTTLKGQLEDKEFDERTARDREQKLRDQVAALESQLGGLRVELQQVKPSSPYQNGRYESNKMMARSATYSSHNSARTPSNLKSSTISLNSSSSPPSVDTPEKQPPSVWDSMHAPIRARTPTQVRTPRAFSQPQLYNNTIQRPVSPAMSTVTQQDDGWWS